jgi:hypothetical protein
MDVMHPQLARCHVKPRHLENDAEENREEKSDPQANQAGPNPGSDGNGKSEGKPFTPGNPAGTRKQKINIPEPSSHLHISALRLWMSLLGGVFGEGFRRYQSRHRPASFRARPATRGRIEKNNIP